MAVEPASFSEAFARPSRCDVPAPLGLDRVLPIKVSSSILSEHQACYCCSNHGSGAGRHGPHGMIARSGESNRWVWGFDLMRVEISRPRESSHAPTDWYDRARVPAWLRCDGGLGFVLPLPRKRRFVSMDGWMPRHVIAQVPFFYKKKKQILLFIFCLFRSYLVSP